MKNALPISVFLSGTGTTLQNLIDRIQRGSLNAKIVQVISSKPAVLGIERARTADLPVAVIARNDFDSVANFSEAIFQKCRDSAAELVCLAGFLQRLQIPVDFSGRVMNIHPSLLPAFGGKGMYGHKVHQSAIEYGVRYTGCTVHFVDDEYDHGPIILQQAVALQAEDTPESLAARVFIEECEAYPRAIQLFAEGRLRVVGRRVVITQ